MMQKNAEPFSSKEKYLLREYQLASTTELENSKKIILDSNKRVKVSPWKRQKKKKRA